MKKKIIYIVLLVLLMAGIVIFFAIQGLSKKETSLSNTKNQNNVVNSQKTVTENSKVEEKTENTETIKTIKTELSEGTLYSLSDQPIKSDVVLGDNYFDTQIRDMNLNPTTYMGKTIEIQGMYMANLPYTFVGRYSLSNLCPTCPAGYSYMEYTWDGEKIELQDETSWIKVVGTLEKLNDKTTNYQDYYYIKAQSIEVMKESGLKTVSN